MAEVVAHFQPKLVEMHNYSAAHSIRQKVYNWQTLNQKVLKKLGYQLSAEDIDALVNAHQGVIEQVLWTVQAKLAEYKPRREAGPGPVGATPEGRPSGAGGGGGGMRAAAPAPSGAPVHPGSGSARGAGAGGGVGAAGGGVGAGAPPMGSGSSVSGDVVTDYAAAGAHSDAALARRDVPGDVLARQVDTDILMEKEQTIQEYKETVQILELKIRKLDQLVRIKDSRIQTLTARVQQLEQKLGLAPAAP